MLSLLSTQCSLVHYFLAHQQLLLAEDDLNCLNPTCKFKIRTYEAVSEAREGGGGQKFAILRGYKEPGKGRVDCGQSSEARGGFAQTSNHLLQPSESACPVCSSDCFPTATNLGTRSKITSFSCAVDTPVLLPFLFFGDTLLHGLPKVQRQLRLRRQVRVQP